MGALLLTLSLLLAALPQTSALGRFEMRLRDASFPNSTVTLKLCLKQFETSLRVDGRCGIGSAEVDLRNVSEIQMPFAFEWKEDYSLIVQILQHERVVDQLAKSDKLRPGTEWRYASTENGTARFEYRILCEESYYGSDCMRRCFPTKNTVCSSDGIPKCAEGWGGKLCREPICEGGCGHGRCIRPGTCLCSSGYEGQRCDQCIPMRGCVHGTCSSPFGCDCEPGWGGTNCNTSTSICTRLRPCLNGGICRPSTERPFMCQCPPGFTGDTCATPLSACAGEGNPCANEGECQPIGTFDFVCRCPEGWRGFYVEGVGCRCPADFEGANCEIAKKRCADGFEGVNCRQAKKENLCGAENVCRNGGWCESDATSFKCHCPRCFSGPDCSLRDPGCDDSQQLLLITVILGVVVVLVLVLLGLIVFLIRRRHSDPEIREAPLAKKEPKIYSLSSEYASRYGADPCEAVLAPNSRLREAAEKALREDPHYAEIDALSSV
ncbi:hypothetical protein QR680_005142 [Steinernema hermaphroditum]|uniref:EGF-like domain-containing protein n=1 Tax=Steinernema hermaphroditum TaxID=289476 RepID=A0AA39HS22_9BILA|nr:hypothetical protein QR680_005142 [Steinernema hermaphroditum]